MCGIVGLHAPHLDPSALGTLLDAMNARQHHRGPDGAGQFIDPARGLGLAMRRLAIIDIAGGNQPMASPCGRYTLVYNGEIMNAPDLRGELEAAGETFHTDHSDTEVLLKLLIREGDEALPRLNGMFAFALFDAERDVLTLGRDRFGIKPLYVTQEGGGLAFASELKSLLALPFVEPRVDRASLFHYLSLMYVPGPATILEGVSRVPPGALLRYRLGDRTISVAEWWRPAYEPDRGPSRRDWVVMIRETLGAAVNRWTLSDVPIACSLSGGLDSAAIVGFLGQGGAPPSTYSLGFRGAGEEAWDELPLAAEVARRWGTDHHEIVLEPDTLLDALPRMVSALDEPYGGGLPSWSVFEAMGDAVKVGLVGSGGDEMFGNYGKWVPAEGRFGLRRRIDRERFRRDVVERFTYFPDAAKRAIFSDGGYELTDTPDLLWQIYSRTEAAGHRDRCAITDIQTQLPDEFLAMTDRFSMANGLEARPPFLDAEFTSLVARIPERSRTHKRDLKGLLREAVAPVLPPELLTAPKRGFVIPLPLWLRGRLRPLVERLLAPERLAAQGLFSPKLYEREIRPYLAGRTETTTRVWGLLMFQLWHAQTFDPKGLPASLAELMDA